MTVFDVMRPISEIRTIQPGTSLKAALEIMSRENLNQLPVVKNDHVEGVLTRSRLLSFLHNRLELQS
jgi:CBS domain-containing protein